MKPQTRWQVATLAFTTIGLLLAASIWHPPAASAAHGDGVLFYASPSNTTPQVKAYSKASNSFGAATNTVAGTQATITQLKTSPTKDEMIAGYENASGTLQIMCFDGVSWTNEWSIVVGGTGTTRRFDIAYETATGDVTVAYSRNTAAVNALAYRTKAGSSTCGSSNWSTATNFPTTTSTTTGVVQWVKASRDGRGTSKLDAFIWADANSDLGAAVWNDTALTNFKLLETSLEVVTSAQDVDDFELQYESLSGDLMVVWANSVGSNGTQGAYYSTCNGGASTCTWLTPAKISTATGDDATNLDLSSDPSSDKMAFSSIGNAGSDLQAAYWSGSAWTIYANLDTTCETPAAGTRITQTGWITNGATTKWIITYDDASGTGLSWYAATPGTAPVVQTDFTTSPAINDIRERYQIDTNPFNASQLMLTLTDTTKTIIAEQLAMNSAGTFSWADASAPSGLGTINTVPTEGFSFQYKRYVPPGSASPDIVDSSGVPVSAPSVILGGLAASSACQTTTGTLSTPNQKIRITNTTLNPAWTVSIAPTDGATAGWTSGTAGYDFNDPTNSGCSDGSDADQLAGQLTITPAQAAITPGTYCSTNGLSVGSTASFNQGVFDAITIATATTSADIDCYWDITNVTLSQTVPAYQPSGDYALKLTLTVVAN